MMALIYLHMLIGVATKNTETQSLELMLMLTQGALTSDVEEEDEQDVLVLIKEGGANLSQTLDNLSPLNVDKKKASYVTRGSNKRKASSNKT
jgi:hypothetical protein